MSGEPGLTLFRKTIKEQELNCAKLLLGHAVEHNVAVLLEWENAEPGEFADCLQYEIKKGLREGVELVMRCLSTAALAAQKRRILKRNFQLMLSRFPDIIEDYFVNNKLAFEVGTLTAPRSAFRDAQERPIAFTSQAIKGTSNEQSVFDFMVNEDPSVESKLTDVSSTTVKAVLKQFPTTTVTARDDSTARSDHTNSDSQVVSALIGKDMPVAVFESEIVRTMVTHEWNTVHHRRVLFALINHLLATVAFTIFSSEFTVDKNGASSSGQLHTARWTIALCFVLTLALVFRGIHPKIRSLYPKSIREKLSILV